MQNKKYKIGLPFLALLIIVAAAAWYFHLHPVAVLDPKGPVAQKERQLIIITVLLSLIVVLPVFGLLFSFTWRYRESNKTAKYSPNLDGNRLAEITWWLIPSTLILIIGLIIWHSSYQLSPYKPLASRHKTLVVQVVALDWKWLFIYPAQRVASVNLVQFPAQTPVDFQITADAPMNSFWIPQLGSQIYAMPGMTTRLNLMANANGTFYGSSANISGAGFAGMDFRAKASSASAFQAWVRSAGKAPALTMQAYDKLAQPSQNNPVAYYSHPAPNLFRNIMMKYMVPAQSGATAMPGMAGMGMQ